MNRGISLETDSCLLIFDPHQNIDWVGAVLEKEKGNFTHLVLGGDYFDGLPGENLAGAGEVCSYLLELEKQFGERLTVLLGNHDIAYLEAVRRKAAGGSPVARLYRCTGYSDERAAIVAGALGENFWRDCRLFQCVNGWLVSHAGVAERFWYPQLPLGEALKALEADCVGAVEQIGRNVAPLLDAGRVRGGNSPVGGITWLDFNREFVDTGTGPPQICGHTASAAGPPRDRARRKGRSWCLDGHQSCYGMLDRKGELAVGVV